MEAEPNRSAVENVKFSWDRSKLAVARRSGQIEMWTVSDGECRWSTQINLDVSHLCRLAFSADDSKLACKEGDKMIVVDAESDEECTSEDTFDFESAYDHIHWAAYVS